MQYLGLGASVELLQRTIIRGSPSQPAGAGHDSGNSSDDSDSSGAGSGVRSTSSSSIEVWLENATMGQPSEGSGSSKLLLPKDCRMRSITYRSPLMADMCWRKIGRNEENSEVKKFDFLSHIWEGVLDTS